jgi:hypothetical protein
MTLIVGLIIFCIICILFTAYLDYRNHQVYNTRMAALNLITQLSILDTKAGREWRWRWDIMKDPSYDQMLYKVWIPVDSYYKNHPCIKDTK